MSVRMVPILSRGDELIDLTDVPLYLIVCFQYGGFKLPFIVVGVLVLAVLPIMFFALEKDRRESRFDSMPLGPKYKYFYYKKLN